MEKLETGLEKKMTVKNKRGGKRDGAGAPSKGEGRVSKQLRVLPDTAEKIDNEAKRIGISKASVVDRWAQFFTENKHLLK